jgi:hypothetical protein
MPSEESTPVTNTTLPSHAIVASPAKPLPPPTTSTFQTANDAGTVAWAGLGTALRELKGGSSVFPPLKSTVSGLLGCLDVLQVDT